MERYLHVAVDTWLALAILVPKLTHVSDRKILGAKSSSKKLARARMIPLILSSAAFTRFCKHKTTLLKYFVQQHKINLKTMVGSKKSCKTKKHANPLNRLSDSLESNCKRTTRFILDSCFFFFRIIS